MWDVRILEEIRRLREKHPNLGKEKLYPLLLDYCDVFGIQECPKPMTIGRPLKDMGGLRTHPKKVSRFGKIKKVNRQKVLRKPKDYKVLHPGDIIALDTVEKQRNGRRMYILTAIDIYTRTTFAIATRSHSYKTFAHFFYLVMDMFPYEIKNVLTDNDSEFDKYFGEYVIKQKIVHFHNYPRCPQMNAYVERFNRTVKEEFSDYKRITLAHDISLFNREMIK